MPAIKRALISVSHKGQIVPFARRLVEFGIEILSTGGTAQLLSDNAIPVVEVTDYTGFPEMMEGRLKTLHPKIHGGLLGRRGIDDEVMASYGISPIDLVVVNLYPFEATATSAGDDLSRVLEHIDIGGVTLIRAAAKNFSEVTVVVDEADYSRVLEEIQRNDAVVSEELRFSLARKAFAHTANYDTAIAGHLGRPWEGDTRFPSVWSPRFIKKYDLRYGENPHQEAAFYRDPEVPSGCVTSAEQLQGKQLSFNNIVDLDTAIEGMKAFSQALTCVIVKHANPCAVAQGDTLAEAYERAFKADSVSAFGGIIAFNQRLEAPTAEIILERQFVEVIVAPSVTSEALRVCAEKPNIRVLATGEWSSEAVDTPFACERITGGILVQTPDVEVVGLDRLTTVTRHRPDPQQLQDLMFAWQVAKFVKSNAIVYCKEAMTLGIGAGQMSRIDSVRIAALKAQDANLGLQGAVLASDAFFPFRDGVDLAAKSGIRAIIQPGGSVRDEEVIAAANEQGIAMVFTGVRHFRH